VAHLHSERSGRMLIFYTPDNVMSYGMARLKSDNLQDPGQTNADLRNRLGGAVREVVGIGRGAFSGNMKVSFQAARSIG
jgi:hypothetical protein